MRLDSDQDRTGGFDGKPIVCQNVSWLAASHESFFSNIQQDKSYELQTLEIQPDHCPV